MFSKERPATMVFSSFIRNHLDEITDEWETFARTLTPSASSLSDVELRDHCREMLLAIALDMETRQTDRQQTEKSKGLAPPDGLPETAAASHGTLRHLAGFDLIQLVSEFRAMRASVLALWHRSEKAGTGALAADEITRFNEAIDRVLAESVDRYSADVDASRDMFLAILGHDLRGPLAVIDLSALLLGKPDLPQASRQQAVVRIRRAVKEMNRLITDLLEYTRSRLGSGIPIERAACNMGTVCDDALEAIRASFPQQQFVPRMAGDLNIQADVPRMHQVLSNLLNNAVQHGDATAPISLNVQGEHDAIALSIANAGQPIPPEALQSIFEPLVQVALAITPESPERSKTSLGLGLFIVREIVQGHGGTIAVESSEQAGTVFTIRLPRAVDRG